MELNGGEIKKLIEKCDTYLLKGETLSEDDVKSRLIEPLFEILGWDMRDKTGKGEVKEQKSQPSGKPDYIFYHEGRIVFFLEAKKLADMTDKDIKQAYNYALSKNKRWAVLSNFQETIILICDTKEDSLQKHIFRRLNYKSYLDDIQNLLLLSKESLIEGVIDKKAAEEGRVKKLTGIGKELLEDITKWRSKLKKNVKDMNPEVYEKEELEEIVQILLNRIIFIRTAEGRKKEAVTDETLKSILFEYEKDKRINIKDSINKIFKDYDQVYDSNLFTYKENSEMRHECEKVKIDNDVLYSIIKGTYEKGETIEYNFADIDADVLGSMYEEYLGHVQERRKKHGIYYTPTYIVDYIVRHTVSELIRNLKPKYLDKIRILDPACGSGSFLIKTFDILNEHYSEYEKKTDTAGTTLDEYGAMTRKVKILKNNIYGVDLDHTAVEIAQLNLLLKAAEQKYRLPALRDNIKIGDSLVDDPAVAGDKAFKWEEQFKEIINNGGFDVIIGNPPYIKEFVERKIFEDVKKGSSRVAKYYEGKMDYLYFFIELGIDLLKDGGYLSFITTNYWLQAEGAKKLREKILKETTLISIFDFNEFTVFEGTGQHNLVFVLQKKKVKNNNIKFSRIKEKNISKNEVIEALQGKDGKERIERFTQPQADFLQDKDFKMAFAPGRIEKVCEKIKSQQNYVLSKKDVAQGIIAPQEFVIKSHLKELSNKNIGDGIFTLSNDEMLKLNLNIGERELIKPFFTSENIGRYFASDLNKRWIIYTTTKTIKEMDKYPHIRDHLDQFKRVITSDFGPYGLHRARDERFFLGEKIVCIRKTASPAFSYVDFPCYVTQTFFIIQPRDVNLKYLIAILNSKLIHFWLYFKGKKEGNQLQIDKAPIIKIPIKITSESQQPFIQLVDKMLSLNKRLNEIGDKGVEVKTRVEEEINKVNTEIDRLVYALYGLTEDEIRIVEESLKL